MKWLSYWVARAMGWRIEGGFPEVPKMVAIGAPHTSNWDFFLFLAAIHRFDTRVRFLGKHTLFRWPFRFMFRKVGGIPVDRARPGGVVGQAKAAFDAEESMLLVIAPEGTRSPAPSWKSGFVEIAETADVPVVLAGVDGRNKILTIGPAEEVGADRGEFMDRVRAFYADKPGIRPEGKGPVRLSSESPVS
jgi:1-acyl-sn-glycerol-3-phosphate acyltransferase